MPSQIDRMWQQIEDRQRWWDLYNAAKAMLNADSAEEKRAARRYMLDAISQLEKDPTPPMEHEE